MLPRAYREGGLLVWRHLLTLVWLNLIWLVLSWTLILAGPVTLAVYALIATSMRQDRDPELRALPVLLRRNLLPGVLWLLTVVLFVFLLYTNVTFWPGVLGPFGGVLVVLLSAYLIWLFVALQPYLLEALSVTRLPFLAAWRAAFLGLARDPVAAHLYVLIPIAVIILSVLFRTFAMSILVSVALTFAAVQVKPFEEQTEPPDEWPDEPPRP